MNKLKNAYTKEVQDTVGSSIGIEVLRKLQSETKLICDKYKDYISTIHIDNLNYTDFGKSDTDSSTNNNRKDLSNYLFDAFVIQIEIAKLREIKRIDINDNNNDNIEKIKEITKKYSYRMTKIIDHMKYIREITGSKLKVLRGLEGSFDTIINRKVRKCANSTSATAVEKGLANSDHGIIFRHRHHSEEGLLVPLMEKPYLLNTILAHTIIRQYILHLESVSNLYNSDDKNLEINKELEHMQQMTEFNIQKDIQKYIEDNFKLFTAVQVIHMMNNGDNKDNKDNIIGLNENEIKLIMNKYDEVLTKGNYEFISSINRIIDSKNVEEIKLNNFRNELINSIRNDNKIER